ncbi:MAG: hypothetical protein HRT44_01480 [Bdellovibrionales bacterium]|nr:hypothetical protein [Bdellovibrionales bacterium]NQZ17918.1 hypothetical protein [Bdellovibrionales bacterium]
MKSVLLSLILVFAFSAQAEISGLGSISDYSCVVEIVHDGPSLVLSQNCNAETANQELGRYRTALMSKAQLQIMVIDQMRDYGFTLVSQTSYEKNQASMIFQKRD